MKTFLKENWFKVGLLVIFLIAIGAGFYLFLSAQDKTSFEQKERCRKIGKSIYEDFKDKYEPENVSLAEYAYSPKLNTCLTYLDYFIPGADVLREVVIDSLTQKEVISYYYHSSKDKEKDRKEKEIFNAKKWLYFSGDVPRAEVEVEVKEAEDIFQRSKAENVLKK